MVAGPLPQAGVSLVAQNLDQFKAQMREANDAVRNMGRESRSPMQQVRDNLTRVISVAGGLTVGMYALGRAYDSTVGKYLAYARQVRETAAATSQEADQVSRLIQLMDDFEIDAGTLTMVMRAMRDEGLTPSVETLAQLSDEFLALEPGAARVDFLIDRFGRSGAVFADVMLAGGDAIRSQAAAISEHLVLSEEDLAVAREHEIAIDNLGDAFQAAGIAVSQRFVPPLTDAARALEILLTRQQRIRDALKQHATDVAGTAESYELYRAELVRAAEAAGYYVDAEGNLRGSRGQLMQANYLLAESEYMLANATQEAAAQAETAVSGSVERMSRLDDETGQVRDRMGEVGAGAERAFGQVNTSLADTITNMRDTAAWIAGGGLQLQAAAEQVNQRLVSGAITPEQADQMLQPIQAAALGLQADIGQITMNEATQQMAEEWGLDWGEARTAIQGAHDDILNLPQEVRTQIAVAVQWSIVNRGEGVPGGQHGLNMVVPSGFPNDSYLIRVSSGEHVQVTAPASMNTYANQDDHRQLSIGQIGPFGGGGPDMANPFERDRVIRAWFGA